MKTTIAREDYWNELVNFILEQSPDMEVENLAIVYGYFRMAWDEVVEENKIKNGVG